MGNPLLQAGWYAPGRMAADAPSSPHSLATASGLLLGTTGAAMLVGALVGAALGGWGIGLLVGAIVGIPLAMLVVYWVYSGHDGEAEDIGFVGRLASTPRPIPGRLAPAIAGTAVILLALPVFAVAGWPLARLGARCGALARRADAGRGTGAAPAGHG